MISVFNKNATVKKKDSISRDSAHKGGSHLSLKLPIARAFLFHLRQMLRNLSPQFIPCISYVNFGLYVRLNDKKFDSLLSQHVSSSQSQLGNHLSPVLKLFMSKILHIYVHRDNDLKLIE